MFPQQRLSFAWHFWASSVFLTPFPTSLEANFILSNVVFMSFSIGMGIITLMQMANNEFITKHYHYYIHERTCHQVSRCCWQDDVIVII